MAKFMLLLSGGNFETFSDEQKQTAYGKYMAWAQLLSQRNQMIDGSELLRPGKRIASGGVISDGPFAESKEAIGGFFLIQANNLDDAAQISLGCPSLEFGGSVEVRQLNERHSA
ncbi:MAG TPA: YciI family protein [Fimbriimonas sp.]|nr:YciI family protein [Fimbriimonas sp.]